MSGHGADAQARAVPHRLGWVALATGSIAPAHTPAIHTRVVRSVAATGDDMELAQDAINATMVFVQPALGFSGRGAPLTWSMEHQA
jgi:hypothetical protein